MLLLTLYLAYLTRLTGFKYPPKHLGNPEENDAKDLLEWLPGLWGRLWHARRIIRVRTCRKRYRLNELFANLGDVNGGLHYLIVVR